MLAGGLRLPAWVLGSPVGSWVQEGRDAVLQPGWLTYGAIGPPNSVPGRRPQRVELGAFVSSAVSVNESNTSACTKRRSCVIKNSINPI